MNQIKINQFQIIYKKSRTEICIPDRLDKGKLVLERPLTEIEEIQIKDILRFNNNNPDMAYYLIMNYIIGFNLRF